MGSHGHRHRGGRQRQKQGKESSVHAHGGPRSATPVAVKKVWRLCEIADIPRMETERPPPALHTGRCGYAVIGHRSSADHGRADRLTSLAIEPLVALQFAARVVAIAERVVAAACVA